MKAIRQQVQFKRSLFQMFNPQILGTAFLLLVLLMLTGCGEDAFVCDSASCASSSSSTSTTTTTTTTTTASGVQIGNGTGAAFQVGIISITNNALTSGGSTTLAVSLVNSDQTAYTTSTQVTFSSTCPTSNISPNPTSTAGGVAAVTYVAGSCAGTDTVTATATVDATNLTATGSIGITVPASNILFGSGTGGTFAQGTLELGTGDVLSAGDPPLSAGGSTTVTATIVDGATNLLYTSFVGTVSFSSACTNAGSANMTSSVAVANGFAQATYVANGCVGDDLITATVVIDGNLVTATQTITVAPASVGSIQFVSANPETIAIQGTGGGGLQETSTLTFRVVDNNGDPVPSQIVNFSLDTTLGGIALSSASGVTGDTGEVTVIVQSGTIHTPVKVTASTTDVNSGITYSTQSDALVISTGLADQDSFSMSIEDCSPESYAIDGVTVGVNILAADHFNNPVPDGTAISFTTEGGSIVGSCNTSGGACTVTWTSQDPRPSDGRVTILATAIGNESYVDLNSSGRYDDGDTAGADLPEAWRDDNENGVRDAGTEEFLDFNGDGLYTTPTTAATGLGWTGVACLHSTNCSIPTSLHVREMGVINMATSSNMAVVNGGVAIPQLPVPTAIPLSIPITVYSTTGQYPATGTNISITTSNGTITGNSSWTVPANCGVASGVGYSFTINMNGDSASSTGLLTITMTSPGGLETIQYVSVSD